MAASQTNQWKQGFCENEQQRWSAEVFNKCWDNFHVGYIDAEIRMFTHNAVRRMYGIATNHIYHLPVITYPLLRFSCFCTYFEVIVNDL